MPVTVRRRWRAACGLSAVGVVVRGSVTVSGSGVLSLLVRLLCCELGFWGNVIPQLY